MRIYKETQEMLAEEEYPIYYEGDNESPLVDLELEDEMIPFVIDTGSVYSLISIKLLEYWGWVGEILPLEEDESSVGCIGLILKLKGILFTDMFCVIKNNCNILGMRAMCHFNCVIDLDAQKITFREFVCQAWETQETDIVRIEGQDVRTLIDTGFTGFLLGSMELAEELKLTLKDISHCKQMIKSLDETYQVKYEAEGVCVNAFGMEKRGVFFVEPMR